ncbi:MAG: 23S rRNA (adenine(2503)-C(2))-methyltransferase RlmN [Anaerolineae bacterium]|nr:23S rRNA (adenine(2503)-C(2))-methyltransferase RlmN [Anaerolineae bacterium]
MENLYSSTYAELLPEIQRNGLPRFRADQIWQGLYKNGWQDWQQFSNLSKEIRQQLAEKYSLMELTPIRELHSTDGQTSKILFQLPDEKLIEAVLMKYKTRNTLCLSTQIGCAMNCNFCATGQMGFTRNLSAGEIVQQVLFFTGLLLAQQESLTNIVYMGMGEPFHNYDAVMKSIEILNDHQGFNFSQRRITISTVGLVPEIHRFTNEHSQVNLAISLHAATDEIRNKLIPINRKYPVNELIGACKSYVNATRRRITFEYALIHGLNDSVQEAENLAQLLHGILCHVNLIPLNDTPQTNLEASSTSAVTAFQQTLERRHIPTSIRLRRGLDIAAGCGQLATNPNLGLGYN